MGSVHDDAARFTRKMFPGVLPLAELLSKEMPPARMTVPGLIPEGVTLLAGAPKIGKTWLAQGLAVAKSAGGRALGAVQVEQGEVLYLALEDNWRRLHKRFGGLVSGEPPHSLEVAVEWPALDEGGDEWISAWCASHADPSLVVIDTLKKVRPRTTGQRSVYDVDYEALEPLIPIAAEHHVAILVLHHTRKMDAADPLDLISGSTGLSGGVDGTLVMKRDRGKADAYLFVDGRDIEEPGEYALRWDQQLTSWQLLGNAEEYRVSETRAKILRALADADGEPMTPADVAVEVGENIDNVRHALRRMDKDGQAKKVGYGKYCHSSHSVISKNGTAPQNDRMTEMTRDTRTPTPNADLWRSRQTELEAEL